MTSIFECELCKDTGVIECDTYTREDGEKITDVSHLQPTFKLCKCREVKRCREILKRSGIAEAFQSKTVREYNPKNELQATTKKMCIEYIKSFEEVRKNRENSIALLGQPGAGKTHLIIAIGNALLKLGIGVIYAEYPSMMTQLKQTIRDEDDFQRSINKYKSAQVLIIDDLYKGMLRQGKVNESDLNILFNIINYRYLNNTPLLVSSEYRMKTLINFDEAIGSRIGEMCKGRIIEFEGKELNHRMR